MSLLVIFASWICLAILVIHRSNIERRKISTKKEVSDRDNIIVLNSIREQKRTEALELLLHEKLVQENSLDDSDIAHGFQKIQWRRKVRKQLGIDG